VRRHVEFRYAQKAFIERGLASGEAAGKSGKYISAATVPGKPMLSGSVCNAVWWRPGSRLFETANSRLAPAPQAEPDLPDTARQFVTFLVN
jgi:hypothetical protein